MDGKIPLRYCFVYALPFKGIIFPTKIITGLPLSFSTAVYFPPVLPFIHESQTYMHHVKYKKHGFTNITDSALQ